MLKEIELLKIGLLTRGMQVSESARKAIEGDEKRPLTLAQRTFMYSNLSKRNVIKYSFSSEKTPFSSLFSMILSTAK